MRKAASAALPVDSAQWGEFMRAELISRLARVEPLIERFKLLESNEEGFGLGLFILEGGKVFIPVVAQDWKIQPMDVIIYKGDNKTEFCYLCERNLHLLQTNTFGRPQGRKSSNVFNSYVNLFSPSGGYGDRTTNPYNELYAGGGRLKTAGLDIVNMPMITEGLEYAIEGIRQTQIPEILPEINQYIELLEDPMYSNFAVIEPVDADSVYVYDEVHPEGSMVDIEEVLPALRDEGSKFMEKSAALLGGSLTTIGATAAKGNMRYLEPLNRTDAIRGSAPQQVVHEGIYYINGSQIVYINPNVNYLDGTPTHEALIVGKGFHTQDSGKYLANKIDSTHSVESAQISKDVLLPMRRSVKTGGCYVLYNKRDKSVTVPFKVILPMEDRSGIVSAFMVQPLSGNPTTVSIRWYNGVQVVDRGREILYPALESEIYEIPELQVHPSEVSMSGMSERKEMTVSFSKGGSTTIDTLENDKTVKRTQRLGEFLYFVIKRYGFSKSQALELIKKILREKNVTIVTDLKEFHTKTDLADGFVKEAITQALRFASRLTKLAAAGAPNPQQAQQQAQQQGDAPGGQPVESLTAGQNQVQMAENPLAQDKLSAIKTIPAVAKEVIEMLTYYALGSIRKEEMSSLYGSLLTDLTSLENSLSKLMLLNQLKQTTGVDYSELKMILADVDNFINRITSAKVLEDM